MRKIADGITREQALCYFGVIVEHGKEEFAAFINSSPRLVQEEVIKFLRFVDEEILFTDGSFTLSLRIALASDIKNFPDNKNWRVAFQGRLRAIFPEGLADRLTETTIRKAREDTKLDRMFPCTSEELHAHFERRRRITDEARTVLVQESLANRTARGTTTWLEKCPQCGLEKRCDQRTKHFHCRCGFDSPYPIP